MSDYIGMSQADLKRALQSLESEHMTPSELKRLVRELQRQQLELECQNRELQDAQQALKESRNWYMGLYDFAPMACVSLDERACIEEINLTGASLLRQDRMQLRDQPFTAFVDPPDVSRFLTHVNQCIEGETQSTELGLRIGGTRIEVRLHSVPFAEGRPPRPLCRTAILDITELRQMQFRLSLSERLASVGTIAAGIAHEINNPLAFLMASLDIATSALRGQAPPPAAAAGPGAVDEKAPAGMALKALGDAHVGAERIQAIVKELVAFAHPSEAHTDHIDVRQVLELSVKMATGELRHRARIVRDYADVPEVIADRVRLGQIFLNLLVNAAQAIPEGEADRNEIRLRIQASGQTVQVQIQDTGPGIPAHVLGRIFDPFFTTKPAGQGTGLGLAISHSLAAQLGGELTVESEPGRGSTFSVRLPAAPACVPAPLPSPPESPRVARRGRVLIVDDEPRFGESLRLLLAASHDVTYIPSARESLSQLQGGARFDVILCDLMMAEATGMRFHEELSRISPDQARRTIFMTGGAYTPTSLDFVTRMSNPLLTKPFKLQALEELLRPLLP